MRTITATILLALAAGLGGPVAATPAAVGSSQTSTFCQAVWMWGTSSAVGQFQRALQRGDKEGVVRGFRAWADDTQAMVDALPVGAPRQVSRGFASLNETIATLGQVNGAPKGALRAYRKARGPVLNYYRRTCA